MALKNITKPIIYRGKIIEQKNYRTVFFTSKDERVNIDLAKTNEAVINVMKQIKNDIRDMQQSLIDIKTGSGKDDLFRIGDATVEPLLKACAEEFTNNYDILSGKYASKIDLVVEKFNTMQKSANGRSKEKVAEDVGANLRKFNSQLYNNDSGISYIPRFTEEEVYMPTINFYEKETIPSKLLYQPDGKLFNKLLTNSGLFDGRSNLYMNEEAVEYLAKQLEDLINKINQLGENAKSLVTIADNYFGDSYVQKVTPEYVKEEVYNNAISLIINLTTKIENIKQIAHDYSNAEWYQKFYGNAGMFATNTLEAVSHIGEVIIDGAASIVGWASLLFSDEEEKDQIANWIKKDHSHEFFSNIREKANIEKYSSYTENSLISKLYRGTIEIVGYCTLIGVTAGTGGIAGASEAGTMTAKGLAFLSGNGAITENAMNAGLSKEASYLLGALGGFANMKLTSSAIDKAGSVSSTAKADPTVFTSSGGTGGVPYQIGNTTPVGLIGGPAAAVEPLQIVNVGMPQIAAQSLTNYGLAASAVPLANAVISSTGINTGTSPFRDEGYAETMQRRIPQSNDEESQNNTNSSSHTDGNNSSNSNSSSSNNGNNNSNIISGQQYEYNNVNYQPTGGSDFQSRSADPTPTTNPTPSDNPNPSTDSTPKPTTPIEPDPTPSSKPTPEPTPTPSPTPEPTPTPSPTPEVTPTPSPTPEPTPTPSPSYDPTPTNNTTPSGHSGGSYSGGGGYNYYTPTGKNTTVTETLKDTSGKTKASIDDIIKGNKYSKIPTVTTPITSKTTSRSSSVIPIAAGLSAAAAAGIGAKAYMDHKKNNNNDDDVYDEEEYKDDFSAEEWKNDSNTIEIEEAEEPKEEYLDEDDEFGYEAPSEEYNARTNESLAEFE